MKYPAILALAVLIGQPVGATTYIPPQPGKEVEVLRETWQDPARARDLPVKIYLPEGGGSRPVVIFSHGLGGNRENYEYLGTWWAGCGYVVVHLQHAGSDDSVWKDAPADRRREALARSALDISNALNRVKDVSFAIGQLASRNTDASSPLYERLDLSRIGLAGHSFGAWTTLALAGQALGPGGKSVADPRIKAAIAMSAPVPCPSQRARAYSGIVIPVLHMTGTLDDSPLNETKAADRRIPFDGMNAAETGLINFTGADHMTFSGRAQRMDDEKEADFRRLICLSGTAFWDAYLRGNGGAESWLADGGLKSLLGNRAELEWKSP